MIIRPLAEADMAQAFNWYEDQRPGLGESFFAAIDDAFQRILRLPEAPALVESDIRRVLVHRFPYAVYYRYCHEQVIVIAVLHMRRSPRVWRGRKE